MERHRAGFFLFLFMAWSLPSSCGLLIGNVKPVDEKSDRYSVMDPARDLPAARSWTRMAGKSSDNGAEESADLAWQSRKTAAVISLNTSCRPTNETEEKDLREFARQLLMGFTEIIEQTENETKIQGVPALVTTVSGRMNRERVKIRSLVLRKRNCVFDLLFIARPDTFDENERDFSQFVASLKLKD